MDNTQRVIFDNNPHVRLRDIFDTAFQHQGDDLVQLNDPRKNFSYRYGSINILQCQHEQHFTGGDSPEPDTSRYYGPDVEISGHRNQLGFRDYNHNNSVGI